MLLPAHVGCRGSNSPQAEGCKSGGRQTDIRSIRAASRILRTVSVCPFRILRAARPYSISEHHREAPRRRDAQHLLTILGSALGSPSSETTRAGSWYAGGYKCNRLRLQRRGAYTLHQEGQHSCWGQRAYDMIINDCVHTFILVSLPLGSLSNRSMHRRLGLIAP